MAEVGLFAMKRDQINRAILPFQVVGIEVDIVQMGPIALYNFITFDQIKTPPARPADGTEIEGEPPRPSKEEKKGSLVLIDIGADNTDLIITDGTRIWQRNVPIGGNHFTRALTKELKLTFAKAEHLKRNATKAPDPRSIFTAMRGVFNDFASEINRSIGFYSSVNRHAKIAKVIGLGNGFKLPGLQKFLQQNLSHEVEKLESFARLERRRRQAGAAVPGEPAVVRRRVRPGDPGARLRSGLRTNLLPPEIEQVRLIRAKKPWALAASALLMLGFSGLFLGDYRVLAKVDTPQFQTGRRPGQASGVDRLASTSRSSRPPRTSGGPSTTRASRWSAAPPSAAGGPNSSRRSTPTSSTRSGRTTSTRTSQPTSGSSTGSASTSTRSSRSGATTSPPTGSTRPR